MYVHVTQGAHAFQLPNKSDEHCHRTAEPKVVGQSERVARKTWMDALNHDIDLRHLPRCHRPCLQK